MPDLHLVYAVTDDLARHRVSGPLDWDTAQRRWRKLDDQRRAQRRQTIGGERVRYFAVRSADDPEWPGPLAERGRIEVEADRPHEIVLVHVRQRRVTPKYSALLTNPRGVIRRHGHSPFLAIAETRRAARRAGII